MKIVVIGAGGFLGEKLVEYFSKNNEVISVGMGQEKNNFLLDATVEEDVMSFITKNKPEVVIDVIALTSSVECERNPKLCKKLNYETARNIAKACDKIGCLMIFTSSSYIFDGKKGDYSETDITNPKNNYSKYKIMAEKEVSKLKKYIISRSDVLYGLKNGKLIFGTTDLNSPEIKVGCPNQIRSPLLVDDFPKALDLIIKNNLTGTFNIAGREKITLLESLKKLTKIKNSGNNIKIVDGSNWVVKVPKNPSLDISKLISLGFKPKSFEEGIRAIESQLKSK